MKQMEFYAKHQKKVSWILKTMRPFLMLGMEFYWFHSMLVLCFFLFDDAVVIFLARLHGVRMS